jgi:hypothetical protein
MDPSADGSSGLTSVTNINSTDLFAGVYNNDLRGLSRLDDGEKVGMSSE